MPAVADRYFIKSLLIACIFGASAGAIAALTIRRTLDKGFLYGLAAGPGPTAADLIYAADSVFGIFDLSDFLIRHQIVVRIQGCILVFLYGI